MSSGRKFKQGMNFIEEVPRNRWKHDDYYQPDAVDSGFVNKTRCKFGAFLNSIDSFDAEFFNIPASEVALMDPQERIALETTWACIEDAGYVPSELGSHVGVFVGMTYNDFQKFIPVTIHSYSLTARISYYFNFQGPAITTDAGCSSSLTAIDLACNALKRNECQTAFVVGSNVILHPQHYTSMPTMLSSSLTPKSQPFGTGDGWFPAEGVVSILLKPLKKVEGDHDHIYGIIKSSHTRQEGKTSWFIASSPKKQAKLIQENFEKSGIRPDTIGYIEAAANGLSLGDEIEWEGLDRAFRRFTDKKHFAPSGRLNRM